MAAASASSRLFSLSNDDQTRRTTALRARAVGPVQPLYEAGDPGADYLSDAACDAFLRTSVNGHTDVTEQGVKFSTLVPTANLAVPEGLIFPVAAAAAGDGAYKVTVLAWTNIVDTLVPSLVDRANSIVRTMPAFREGYRVAAGYLVANTAGTNLPAGDQTLLATLGAAYTAADGNVAGNASVRVFRTIPAGPDVAADVLNSTTAMLDNTGAVGPGVAGGLAVPATGTTVYSESDIDGIFGMLSQMLRMNYDLRDTGLLLRDGMRVADGAWQRVDGDQKARLQCKAHHYTVVSTAALNTPQVNGWSWGGVIRSYGVNCGFLADDNSASNREYYFTRRMPQSAQVSEVTEIFGNINFNALQVAVNIIAMFGLQHLHRDHTYRTGDNAMARSNGVYVECLRTIVPPDVLTAFKGHMEEVNRTAAHPFGLAQTYFVAQAAHRAKFLAEALDVRVDVCPPRVQRAMIVHAAALEWSAMPAGARINKVFAPFLARVTNFCDTVRGSPPLYSDLYRLYGVDEQRKLTDDATEAVRALMPISTAYAMVYHGDASGDASNKREGLALAQSMNNAIRDYKAVIDTYQTLWARYRDNVEDFDLVEYISGSVNPAV